MKQNVFPQNPGLILIVALVGVITANVLLNLQPSSSRQVSANNPDAELKPSAFEMLKSGEESLQNPADTTPVSQTQADVAMSPNGLYATVWIDPNDQNLKFTLRDSNNGNVVVGTPGTVINTTSPVSHPSVSFYTDTDPTSPGYNRFVVAWQGSNGTDQDIYYREIDKTGTPDGIPTIINNTTIGNQVSPDIAAAKYGTDSTTRRFAITWLEDRTMDFTNESVYGGSMGGNNLGENLLTSTCAKCMNSRVTIDDKSNNIVYVWDDKTNGPEILFQKAIGSALEGTPVTISDGDGEKTIYQNPDVAFLGDSRSNGTNDFIISFDNYGLNRSGSENEISTAVYAFDNSSKPITTATVSTGGMNFNGKIAAKQQEAKDAPAIMAVWNTFSSDQTDNNIYGKIMKFAPAGESYGIIPVTESAFRINETEDGDQFAPSVSMNTTGKIVAAWEGKWESNPNQSPSTSDTHGIISQLFNNPLFTDQAATLMPQAYQQINRGARTLSVPDSIGFSSTSVNTNTSTIKSVSIRDNINGGSNLKYFEVQDLLGDPFNITIVADADFMNSADGQSHIARSDFAVRNWDQDITGVDTNCAEIATGCFLTIEPASPPFTPTFSLDVSTSTFQPLNTSQTLATKNGTDIGRWRWYPEFQLTIPALTPPGNHTTSITATLN